MPHYLAAPELTEEYISSVWDILPQHLRPTLLLQNQRLSTQLGCHLTIVSEMFQYTGSFKFRAAYNLLSPIPQQHVATASSGNFGQAVAYACKLLGKTCDVVMPHTSAQVKIAAVQAYGGKAALFDVHKIRRAKRRQQPLPDKPSSIP